MSRRLGREQDQIAATQIRPLMSPATEARRSAVGIPPRERSSQRRCRDAVSRAAVAKAERAGSGRRYATALHARFPCLPAGAGPLLRGGRRGLRPATSAAIGCARCHRRGGTWLGPTAALLDAVPWATEVAGAAPDAPGRAAPRSMDAAWAASRPGAGRAHRRPPPLASQRAACGAAALFWGHGLNGRRPALERLPKKKTKKVTNRKIRVKREEGGPPHGRVCRSLVVRGVRWPVRD